MAEYVILLLIVFLVLLDASTLQEENSPLYTKIIKRSPREYAVFSLLLFAVAGPLYYLKRTKMLRLMNSGLPEKSKHHYSTPNFSIITEVAGLILQWFILVTIVSFAFMLPAVLHISIGDELLMDEIQSQLQDIIFIFLVYITIKRNRNEGFFKSLSFNIKNLPAKFIVYPFLFAFLFIMVDAIFINNHIFDVETPLGKSLESGSDFSLLFHFTCAIFLAPFFEEIIFRGYLFPIIKEIKGDKYAITAISLLFALAHVDQLWGDWITILTILGLSFCLTWLRARSGSVIPGMICHFTYNSVLIIGPLLTGYFI
jgi:membrane protease YdiL (CAAX protease family)